MSRRFYCYKCQAVKRVHTLPAVTPDLGVPHLTIKLAGVCSWHDFQTHGAYLRARAARGIVEARTTRFKTSPPAPTVTRPTKPPKSKKFRGGGEA